MAIFEYAEKTVADLFDKSELYIIPNYQRPYAWKEKHIRELWEDLVDNIRIMKDMQNNGKLYSGYFLGPIFTAKLQILPDHVLAKLGNNTDGFWLDQNSIKIQFFNLLDGQQRLVSLYMLLSILKVGNGDIALANGSTVPKMILAHDDADFFEHLIKTGIGGEPQTNSQRLLQAVYNDLCQRVDTLPEANAFKAYLLNEVKMIRNDLQDPGFSIQIFNAQNDRGKKLTYIERMKSLFMLYDDKFCSGLEPPLSATIDKVYGNTYRVLDQSIETQIFEKDETGENEFLKTFYVLLNIAELPDAMWASPEFIFDEYFKKEIATNSCQKIADWIRQLEQYNHAIAYLSDKIRTKTHEDYAVTLLSLRPEIRSLALLCRLHTTFPQDALHTQTYSVDKSNSAIYDLIQERIKQTLVDFQRQWQSDSILDAFFNAEVTALHSELDALQQEQQNPSKISVLELITSLQLAVWKLGNPRGTFSRCWRTAFITPLTPANVVATFWDGLIVGYRIGLINFVLNVSGDFSFILKEYERTMFGQNIHFALSPDFATLPLDLEHIFPVEPPRGISFKNYGFAGENSYRDFLNKIENRTYIHESLNRGAQNNPPFLKIDDYISQQASPNQMVDPVVQTTTGIGNALDQIRRVVGTQSPLYRAWLQLWGVRLAIFVAKQF